MSQITVVDTTKASQFMTTFSPLRNRILGLDIIKHDGKKYDRFTKLHLTKIKY